LITGSEDSAIFFSKIKEYAKGEDVTIDLMKIENKAQDIDNLI